jgi:hypothetical protein
VRGGVRPTIIPSFEAKAVVDARAHSGQLAIFLQITACSLRAVGCTLLAVRS